ncbi:SDR family NAD(P)-dependent oxidoreductase [Saccharomonospora glauca]|uniref:Short-chain alcohol dehydrogenase like protein n=1 Tax=Saccharomonospora glauca K62 TaxID=928724 RepID=I1D2G0_9PSEU|nr:SDR family oxidoreductase [Saccharomonospora glauca]EIE99134.1 dehydrogenase of unknown specificity [Saccharomonospora glauca K62]
MSATLAGRGAIVSGSSRGIGRAVAERLAAEGAGVVVNGMDKKAVDDTVATITSAGGAAVGYVGDVTADGFAEEFVATAVREFGSLDIVVNNAGFPWDNVIQKTTDEQWDTMLDTHLKAPFRILRAAQPILRDQAKNDEKRGRYVHRKVVNVSSIAAIYGNVGQVGYASAKAGIFGLTKTLAKEWGRYRVNVNAVAFGIIDTRLISSVTEGHTIPVGDREIPIGVNDAVLDHIVQTVPLGRFGTVTEAAGSIYLFCCPDSDYVTGEILTCGGGVTI